MTQKEIITQHLDQELGTTLKVLRAFPEEKLDLKPSAKSRTAKELAWVLVSDVKAFSIGIDGEIFSGNPAPPPLPPSDMKEIIGALEGVKKEVLSKLNSLSEDRFNQKTLQFPVGPKQMGTLPLHVMGWVTIKDHVHHRGQFSVYLRLAGGKVPSIYGPTADEPWM